MENHAPRKCVCAAVHISRRPPDWAPPRPARGARQARSVTLSSWFCPRRRTKCVRESPLPRHFRSPLAGGESGGRCALHTPFPAAVRCACARVLRRARGARVHACRRRLGRGWGGWGSSFSSQPSHLAAPRACLSHRRAPASPAPPVHPQALPRCCLQQCTQQPLKRTRWVAGLQCHARAGCRLAAKRAHAPPRAAPTRGARHADGCMYSRPARRAVCVLAPRFLQLRPPSYVRPTALQLARARVGRMFSWRLRRLVRVQIAWAVSRACSSLRSAGQP